MSKAKKINDYLTPIKRENAIIYCRVSSERQKNEGHGLDSQEQRCKQYANERGYKVAGGAVFKDSFSGFGDYRNRPALQQLFEYLDAHSHIPYVVLIDDLSRFARDVTAHFKLKKELKERDVALECTNFNFEDTPEGELIEAMMAAQHQYHRTNNRRQVIQKQKARLELGYWAFGAKKGYEMKKHPMHGKLSVPKQPEATYLKEALEGFANGRFLHKVDACRYLVEKGFWKKQKPERYIDKFTLLLRDPFYVGYIEYPMWEVERRKGHHKGIISLEVFDQIQERLDDESKGRRIRRDTSVDFPLRGLIVCGCCGKHMTAAWHSGRKKKYAYYFCQNNLCEEHAKMCPKDKVEEAYDCLLKKSYIKDEISAVLVEIFNREWDVEISHFRSLEEELMKDKREKEEQIQNLITTMSRTTKTSLIKAYETQIEKLSDEVSSMPESSSLDAELDIPYQTSLEKSKHLLKSPYEIWHSVDVIEKQKLFNFIFEAKLPYTKTRGYQTAEKLSYVRVFEEFVTTSSQDVDIAKNEWNQIESYIFESYYMIQGLNMREIATVC